MKIAVLGSVNGDCTMVSDLSLKGYDVILIKTSMYSGKMSVISSLGFGSILASKG